MTSQRSLLTVERSLYLAFFALALALRLYQLNAHPLTDAEAREALLAYRLIRGTVDSSAAFPHSPAYFFFTYLSFLVFDASDATARLAPALFGSAFVFLPAFFSDRLGRAPALFVGGLLAVSSGLLAAARSADGAIIALFGLGFGLGALRRYLAAEASAWLIASGVLFGIGLAAGAAFLTGLFIVGVTSLVVIWVNSDERSALREAWARVWGQGKTFLMALGLTALVVATTASMYRLGLGALGASWMDWLRGFALSASGRSPQTILTFLIVYEPLFVVFGVLGAVRAFRTAHRPAQRLSWFSLVALAFVTLYGGRTLFDVIWVSAPLAALAGWVLAEIFASAWARQEWPLIAAQVGVIAALFIFSALNLAALAEQARANPDFSQGTLSISGLSIPVSRLSYLYLSLLALGLVFVVSYLFGMGWSPRAARLGLTLGSSAALLCVNLSAGWGLTQLRANDPVELWWEKPTADGLRRLVQVLSNTSNYAVGDAHDIQVAVQAPPDGALAWALRGYPHAAFVEVLGANVDSPVVIAPFDELQPPEAQNPQLGSSYVGQSFPVRYSLAPAQATWPDQLNWLMFRRASTQFERVIIWVRQDIQQLQTAQGR